METKFNFADTFGEPDARMAYVKSVKVADLPDELQEAAEGRELLFAIHDSGGQQLALVAEREMAIKLVRQNDMDPVTVQ